VKHSKKKFLKTGFGKIEKKRRPNMYIALIINHWLQTYMDIISSLIRLIIRTGPGYLHKQRQTTMVTMTTTRN